MSGETPSPGVSEPQRDVTTDAALAREVEELRRTVRDLRERLAALQGGEGLDEEAEERLRRTQEEARETRERLAHVARVSTLGEMATGIAHEINQPLAAVAAYAQACGRMIRSRTADDVELLEALERIGHEALRAGAIINKLKELVRRRDSGLVPCDLNTLVRDVAGLAVADANHNGVDLRLSLDDDLPPVTADPVQIQQVVLNLVRNGIEAMDGCYGERVLRVRTAADGDGGVTCSVVDGGVGIANDEEEGLFTPSTRPRSRGWGWGFRSPAPSSVRTAARCGSHATRSAARRSTSGSRRARQAGNAAVQRASESQRLPLVRAAGPRQSARRDPVVDRGADRLVIQPQ